MMNILTESCGHMEEGVIKSDQEREGVTKKVILDVNLLL